MNSLGSKWTVWGGEQSKGMKVVMFEIRRSKRAFSGRSAKVDGPKIYKWTVLKDQTGRSLDIKADVPNGWKWTVKNDVILVKHR